MKLYSVLTDWFFVRILDYNRFKVKSDRFHLELTLSVLKKYEKDGALLKEFNVLGTKSQDLYMKSSGYYIKNLNLNNKTYSLNSSLENDLYKEQTINNYFNSTVYLLEKEKAINTSLKKELKPYQTNNKLSPHKELLFLITKLRLDMIEEAVVVDFITESLNRDIEGFIAENAFEEGKNNGSSHEFGYWLNYMLDFQEYYNNTEFKSRLSDYFEKLHHIFVRRKMFYHDVVGKDKLMINVSGVILISKAFFRYTIYSKDYRFANAGMFLIDFVKQIQINNKGFIQNTFPIYKGNSKLKFPSWTINYYLEALILKKQVLDEFENCVIN